jgi:O-antigen/teichoic acid export membrane protein
MILLRKINRTRNTMKIKSFLIQSDNIERDSFIWNMAGSMIMAFQSVIMLMILTRVLGLIEAGVFTIAYANANLFLTIGKYGVRNFQVSDVTGQFTFREYYLSRIVTSAAMLSVSVLYVLYAGSKNGYSMEKSMVIIWMCFFKVIDVLEDVYHGLYQQKGRLDVAGKALTLRLGITLLVFAVSLFAFKDLLLTLIIATVITLALFFLFTKWSYEPFRQTSEKRASSSYVWRQLKICFPLFLGSFLSFYIGNAPKYAIDRVLNDELQACYGFIAMPVFVIGLLNGFIFNPMVYKMSIMWNKGKKKEFMKLIWFQTGIVAGITVVCMIGAYLLGIPVLSVLYNTDLSAYKKELLVLLLGGGFLALSGLLATIITIIRFQDSLLAGYVAVAVLACMLSGEAVERYLVMGAAGLYLVLMAVLCLIFTVLLIYGVRKKGKKDEKAV